MKKIDNDYTKTLNIDELNNNDNENKKPNKLSTKQKIIILVIVGIFALASLIGMIILIIKYNGAI